MKSDYRTSNTIVYNNFVWPRAASPEHTTVPVEELVSDERRENIESCAQAVLDARAAYECATLARTRRKSSHTSSTCITR
ncbi:hypothetical protein ACFPVT_04035 [Corynebacterium choanae]|uniref:hypothetical protein n=1 Tax=Corynebacterium choanae TaxID=1862358 RepID=UPI00319E1616